MWAMIVAANVYGETPQSTPGNNAVYNRVPDSPISVSEDITVRTSDQDGITWSDGAHDGGLPVLNYRIKMREQGGTLFPIAVGWTTQSYTVTGLVLGTTYEFTIESQNSVGYSDPSEILTILHAIPPEVPATPTTSNNGQEIVITWSAPANNGDEIDSYQILIRQSDGLTFTEELVTCDGTDATIVSTQTCSVPLATLTNAPYSLNSGDEVFVTVSAINVKGSSGHSSAGSGAIIITKPDAPINLIEDTT